jgi:N6-L-threonylcarbamoyladenine synthase
LLPNRLLAGRSGRNLAQGCLAGALLVGASVAAGLGFALGVPVLGIHHLEGHLLSPLLATPAPRFPFIALLVSAYRIDAGRQRGGLILGETVDDAAGEAFDKTANLLGLPYPGGPALSALADKGSARRFRLPRPMLRSADLNFSFSGLKTAVLTLVNQASPDDTIKADIAAAFQEAIVEVLTTKAARAVVATGLDQLVVAGGVGANRQLREALSRKAQEEGFEVFYPPLDLCTDNGAMIAHAGALRLSESGAPALGGFTVRARWDLEDLKRPASA